MNRPLSSLQHLLLDLLSPIGSAGQQELDALNTGDWEALLDMARQHRLEPLLHWQLDRHKARLDLPETIRAACAEAFERSTLRALAAQRELLLVHRILEDAGIPYLALKGAYLAFHAYPHPGLRPLRDLDLLVARERAPDAFNALLAHGAARAGHGQGDPEFLAGSEQHLPALRSPSGVIWIEVHGRLFHLNALHAAQAELSDDPAFWQRVIARPVARVPLRFSSPTDLLLHLIVHSVYDHQFDNGPLILSDMAFLLDRDEIDWPLFWRLARSTGHEQGAALALRLVERHWGARCIAWPGGAASAPRIENDVLDLASRLTLRDFASRLDSTLALRVDRQASPIGRMALLARKLFPARAKIATEYAVDPKSLRAFLFYPRRWWRLVTDRMPRYFGSLRKGHIKDEVEGLNRLNDWLHR